MRNGRTNWAVAGRGAAVGLPTLLIVAISPALVFIVVYGGLGLLARVEYAVVDWYLVRESVSPFATHRFPHELARSARHLAGLVFDSDLDRWGGWGGLLASARLDWPFVLMQIGAMTLGAFLLVALRVARDLQQFGFRGDSRLRVPETLAIQVRIARRLRFALPFATALATAAVPLWILLPWVVMGLSGSSTVDWRWMFDTARLSILVFTVLPVASLLVSLAIVPGASRVAVVNKARRSPALCARCGYPRASSTSRCPECGSAPAHARPFPYLLRTNVVRGLTSRVSRVLWIVAGVGTVWLLCGGHWYTHQFARWIGGRPVVPLNRTGGLTVFLRSGEPYVFRLDGEVIVIIATNLDDNGHMAAAGAWRDSTGGTILTSRLSSTFDSSVPTVSIAHRRWEFYPYCWNSGQAHPNHVLAVIADRPAGASVQRVIDCDWELKARVSPLVEAAHSLATGAL